MEQASEASVAKWSATKRASGSSERTQRATKWPVKNAIVFDQKRAQNGKVYDPGLGRYTASQLRDETLVYVIHIGGFERNEQTNKNMVIYESPIVEE